MSGQAICRPEEGAVLQALENHVFDAAGTAIRLAWQAGLTRLEIVELLWERVSFLNGEIELPDRRVPLCAELAAYLERLSARMEQQDRYVLLSDCRRRPMRPQPLSRLVRQALDEVGQTEISLRELRHDFILRRLEEDDWQYVSRVSGVEAAALNLHFAPQLSAGAVSTRIDVEKKPQAPDELRLRRLLQSEGASAAGLCIRLVWQAGLRVQEAAALTWGQVDFAAGVIRLERGEAPLCGELAAFLRPLEQEADRHLLLTPRTLRPMGADRLSRLARAALIQAGLDNVTLQDLWCDHQSRSGCRGAVLEQVRQAGSVSRKEVTALCGVTRSTAYETLARLVRQGELVRLGTRYYRAGTVIAPKDQYETVRVYLEETGVAYRQDLARALKLEPRPCSFVLKTFVDRGLLRREGQRYYLPEEAQVRR